MQLVFSESRFQRDNSSYENEWLLKKPKVILGNSNYALPGLCWAIIILDAIIYAETAFQRLYNE